LKISVGDIDIMAGATRSFDHRESGEYDSRTQSAPLGAPRIPNNPQGGVAEDDHGNPAELPVEQPTKLELLVETAGTGP
jgi:hypothetical protein